MNYREEIKEWLDERAPLNFEKNDIRYVNMRLRAQRRTQQMQQIRQKARISVRWRESLARRLGLNDDEIVRATNTIIELIEQELARGGTVRLAGFGDFVLQNGSEGEKKLLRFRPAKEWLEEINEPQFADKIGLLRSYKKGRLTRRNITEENLFAPTRV
jgi:hypothetical protein